MRAKWVFALALGAALIGTADAGDPVEGYAESDTVTGLVGPTGIAFLPDGRLLVTQLGGELILVDGGVRSTLATIPVCFDPTFDLETGLLGIAVHPDFPADRSIYLYRTLPGPFDCFDATGRFNEIVRVTLEANDTVDLDSLEVLLTGIGTDTGYHNGGVLRIGADRLLYAGVGDSGLGDDDVAPGESTNPYAQDLSSLNGKILRIDLDGSIPQTNPFVGTAGARGEIFAYGFRNPWRMSFDPQTDRLWVGDVGELALEEIDIVDAGGNYGWPHCEATLPRNCEREGDTPPVFSYPHSGPDSLGDSITGGDFAEGGALAIYSGDYFFGDFGEGDDPTEGALYRARPNGARDGIAGVPQLVVANAAGPVDVVVGPDGALYYIAIFDGAVRRVVSTLPTPESCENADDCEAALELVLPTKDQADGKAQKKTAKQLGKLFRKAAKARAKAAATENDKKRARFQRSLVKNLEKLRKKATKAAQKQKLAADIDTVDAGIDALLGFFE